MEAQKDFEELLGLFNSNHVEYLVVGAYALACHGIPRFTGDLDIFVNPTPDNARRILSSLEAFGFGSLDLAITDFMEPDRVVQLGVPPVRIDLLTSLTGVTWKEAFDGKVAGSYGTHQVSYLGRTEFIRNKKALGRMKDLADIEALGEDP